MSGARVKSQWKINALLLMFLRDDAFSASSCPEPRIMHLDHILILKSFLVLTTQKNKHCTLNMDHTINAMQSYPHIDHLNMQTANGSNSCIWKLDTYLCQTIFHRYYIPHVFSFPNISLTIIVHFIFPSKRIKWIIEKQEKN